MDKKRVLDYGDELDFLIMAFRKNLTTKFFKRASEKNLPFCSLDSKTGEILLQIFEEEVLSMGKLAKLSAISSRSIYRPVSILEEKGLVRRFVSPKDKKVVLVKCTELGKQFALSYHETANEVIIETLDRKLSLEAQQALFDDCLSLTRLVNKLK